MYLDNNASTPLDERVLEAMRPYLERNYANASALYSDGRAARAAIDNAREQVADLVGAHPSQVVFTGGGTEANNLAMKGAVSGMGLHRVAISNLEHSSILQAAAALRRRGCQVVEMPVLPDGRLDLQGAAQQIVDGQWVTLMWANNETGVLQDVAAMAALARERGAYLHTDAVQAIGKTIVDFDASGAHALTLSAHKIYGPKGVGAVVFDRTLDIEPLIHGGGHEQGLRAGTENVAGIVGFGQAAIYAKLERELRNAHSAELLELFERRLAVLLPEAVFFGKTAPRLSNTSFIGVPGIHGETLLTAMDGLGFAIGSGSACESRTGKPSHVLTAMGVSSDIADSAVRISLSHRNTKEDIERFVKALAGVVMQLRGLAAMRTA